MNKRRRKMRLRIDRMLFSSEVTKLRKDAQNLQPEKKASKTWSCQTTLLDRKLNIFKTKETKKTQSENNLNAKGEENAGDEITID